MTLKPRSLENLEKQIENRSQIVTGSPVRRFSSAFPARFEVTIRDLKSGGAAMHFAAARTVLTSDPT